MSDTTDTSVNVAWDDVKTLLDTATIDVNNYIASNDDTYTGYGPSLEQYKNVLNDRIGGDLGPFTTAAGAHDDLLKGVQSLINNVTGQSDNKTLFQSAADALGITDKATKLTQTAQADLDALKETAANAAKSLDNVTQGFKDLGAGAKNLGGAVGGPGLTITVVAIAIAVIFVVAVFAGFRFRSA